ncbi:MAG: MoaD/ThiS family protein [Thermacetogeniaceae bacterium]
MKVNVYFYAEGIDMFVPNARFGEKTEVEAPEGAIVGDVLKKLGIPLNVFGVLLNGKSVPYDKKCSENDSIYIVEAINGA